MSEVFELVERDDEQVVIKVHADDNLIIAKHPYISSNMDYITLTHGYDKDHIFTVIRKDGTTWSFHWGPYSATMTSSSVHRLRDKVLQFLITEGGFSRRDFQ